MWLGKDSGTDHVWQARTSPRNPLPCCRWALVAVRAGWGHPANRGAALMASQTDRFQAALLVGDATLPRPHVMQAMQRLAHQVLWAEDTGAAFKRALAVGAEVVIVTEDIPVEQSLA